MAAVQQLRVVGAGQRTTEFHAAANGEYGDPRGSTGHHHTAGESRCSLRAGLRSRYIWGPPAWGYYPSLYYPAFGFGWGSGINLGFCFGGWGGWGGWGWGPNWFGRTVIVNNNFFHRYGFNGGPECRVQSHDLDPRSRPSGRCPLSEPATCGTLSGGVGRFASEFRRIWHPQSWQRERRTAG